MEPQREPSEAVGLDDSIEELLEFEPNTTAPARQSSAPVPIKTDQSKSASEASPTPAETENVLNYIKP